MSQKPNRRTTAGSQEQKVDNAVKPRDVVERWGGDQRILTAGFVAVPVLFLQRMSLFKPFSLTPAEALFAICVMAHKWDERNPYPSYKRIAAWMGKSESYVRQLAKHLEEKSLLKRQPRVGQTNAFDFTQLFDQILSEDAPGRSAKLKRQHPISTPAEKLGQPKRRTRAKAASDKSRS